MEGHTAPEVAVLTRLSKGTVSNYLNEIEEQAGCAIVRGKVRLEKKDAVQKGRAEGKGPDVDILEVDNLLLAAVDPAGEDEEEEVRGVEGEFHSD